MSQDHLVTPAITTQYDSLLFSAANVYRFKGQYHVFLIISCEDQDCVFTVAVAGGNIGHEGHLRDVLAFRVRVFCFVFPLGLPTSVCR